jgi:hypothetical protein
MERESAGQARTERTKEKPRAATTLDREQQAIADFLSAFSMLSAREGIGPCTLAAMVRAYAEFEEGVTVPQGRMAPIFEAASAKGEEEFMAYRARQDRLDRAAGA